MAATTSGKLKWTLRISFAFFICGLILIVVGASLYFANINNASGSCLVVRNQGFLFASSSTELIYGIVTASCLSPLLCRPPLQQISVTQGYTNATQASLALVSFVENSTFFCVVSPDGLLYGADAPPRSTTFLQATLALFILGCCMCGVWCVVAAVTLVYSCHFRRPYPVTAWGKVREWVSWWWIPPAPDSEDEMEQQQQPQPQPQQERAQQHDFS